VFIFGGSTVIEGLEPSGKLFDPDEELLCSTGSASAPKVNPGAIEGVRPLARLRA
jgi:hypothetical protein